MPDDFDRMVADGIAVMDANRAAAQGAVLLFDVLDLFLSYVAFPSEEAAWAVTLVGRSHTFCSPSRDDPPTGGRVPRTAVRENSSARSVRTGLCPAVQRGQYLGRGHVPPRRVGKPDVAIRRGRHLLRHPSPRTRGAHGA